MSDREQLIRQIADNILFTVGAVQGRLVHKIEVAAVFEALDRLGYSVVPGTVTAEAPRIAGDELEGSEATTEAARVRACEFDERFDNVDTPGRTFYTPADLAGWLLNGDR